MLTIVTPRFTADAQELMSRPVEVISQDMSLRSAAALLIKAHSSGAPVVDTDGRCVGVLSAVDFVRWTKEGAKGVDDGPVPPCLYQHFGQLLNGDEAMICRLSAGSCSWQKMQPTTGGRRTVICLLPKGVRGGPLHEVEELPNNPVRHYMTTEIVTVRPEANLPELARIMADAHIHRVIVVDLEMRPVGIVTSSDILRAIADGQESHASPRAK